MKHKTKRFGLGRRVSLPTRERGLKPLILAAQCTQRQVAPHAGAWIETIKSTITKMHMVVAPHAGAWIETRSNPPVPPLEPVAPHAGAWIETSLKG